MARDHETRASRLERRQLRSRRHNPDGTMTLRDHIYELRHRLGLGILFILLGGIVGFVWFSVRIGPIPSLGDLLLKPYCQLPESVRFAPNHQCQLLQTKPFEAFLIQFKVGVAAGMVLTAPLWLYQLWAFITPGLYAKERKFARYFVLFASVLFMIGAVLAYFVVPQGLSVLVSFGGNQFVTALAGADYVSFVLVLLLIFGVSFELPLVIVMLNRIGMVSYDNLRRWRRGIIFALFVFAAIATPGTDPISMVALAAAMTVLFELAVQITRVHDRRKARRLAAEDSDYTGLSDDEPSPAYQPEPVEPAAPVEPTAPTDVHAGLDDVT